MRGKSSSKGKNGLGTDKPENPKDPQLSGAYIRSLVKQLTSSRTSGGYQHSGEESCEQKPQQHKKQVRRRLHTARPYQDGLLNMAEARREIVAALKFHRAAMKQASEKQNETGPGVQTLKPSSEFGQESPTNSRRNPRIYPDNSSGSPGFCSPCSWPVSSSSAPPPQDNLRNSSALPARTLGLNLNLHDFASLDIASSSIFSSSSPSGEILLPATAGSTESGLHPANDDKEMAEIRSIGEQYQMEWNDMVNSANSAWWFEFLRAMETDGPENGKGEDSVHWPFDEVMEFPGWLNANDGCLQRVEDIYVQDPALPCLEIDKLEGTDGGWLA